MTPGYRSSQICHLYVNDLEPSNAHTNTLIFEALLCSSHACLYRWTWNWTTLFSTTICPLHAFNAENIPSRVLVLVFKCPFKWTADTGGGKEKRKSEWWNKRKKERIREASWNTNTKNLKEVYKTDWYILTHTQPHTQCRNKGSPTQAKAKQKHS